MKKMKAVEVRHPGGPLQLVERDVPKPGTGQVLIKVQRIKGAVVEFCAEG